MQSRQPFPLSPRAPQSPSNQSVASKQDESDDQQVAQSLLSLKLHGSASVPVGASVSSPEVVAVSQSAPAAIQANDASGDGTSTSIELKPTSPVMPPESAVPAVPVVPMVPPPGLVNANSQMSVPLQPTLPFSLITLSRKELVAFVQCSASVKRPSEFASNRVITLQSKQDPSGQRGDCVRVQRVEHALDAMPIAQLVSPDSREPVGFLIPTEVNALEVPNAILLPAASQEKSSPLYSINIPLQDSSICCKQRICRKSARELAYSLGKAFSFITLTLGPLRFSSRGPRRLP